MTNANDYTTSPPRLISTLTNAAFLVPAYFAITSGTTYGFVYAATLILLAVTSAAFHWQPLNELYREADVSSIYAVFAAVPFFVTGDPAHLALWPIAGALIWDKLTDPSPIDSHTAVPGIVLGAWILMHDSQNAWPALVILIFYVIVGAMSNYADRRAAIRGRGMGARNFIESDENRKLLVWSDVMHGITHVLAAAALTIVAA